MTAPELVKLTKPDDAIAMRVTACGPMKIGDYPEVEYVGVIADGKTCAVRVPAKSSERQLDRLELTHASVIGQTILFKRDPSENPKKPYWGLYVADEPIDAPQKVSAASAPKVEATAAATSAQSEPLSNGAKSGAALYAKITDFALEKIVPKYQEKGIQITMEGVAAITATLYIAATRNHH